MILKRSLSFLIASVMLFVLYGVEIGANKKYSTAIAESAVSDGTMPQYTHIEYEYRKGLGKGISKKNETDKLSFEYSDEMWFGDAEEMNADIIKIAVALSCSAYYNFEAPIRERTIRVNSLFTQMGFHCKKSDLDTNDLALDDYYVDYPTLDDCNTEKSILYMPCRLMVLLPTLSGSQI